MGGGKGSKEFQKQMKAARDEVKKLGDSASEGAKLLAQIGEEGMISAEMVGMAMSIETSPGGRFYNGMEKASQTMSGLFSTLQDDAMQLAGNVFEPLAGVLTNTVLPAAIGAVGALNSLFEQDGAVNISVETQEAINTLNSLDTNIQSIKNKYVTEAIKIKIDYQESMDLLNQLSQIEAGLEGVPKRLWSDQDKEDLKALTEQLVALNPELAEHVGKDGLLNKEAEAVRSLITEYKNLALQKAATAAQEGAWQAYFDAEIAAETIRNQNAALTEQMRAAIATGDAWTTMADNAGNAWDALTFKTADMIGMEQMTSYVELARTTMQSYIDMAGGLGPELFKGIDLSAFFDGFSVMSAEEIMSSADGMAQLGEAMKIVGDAAIAQEGTQQTVVSQLQAEIEAGNAAITAAEASVASALSYAEAMSQTVTDIASGVSGIDISTAAETATGDIATVQEAGDKLGESEWKPTMDADDQASGKIADVDSKLSNLDGKTATVTINYSETGSGIPKHKTGLDCVPFDNYLALLHKGEKVLTAAEARVYDRLTDPGYASRLATRAVGTGAGIGDRVIRETYVNQTNNFNVPVQTPDEFAQMMREFATYGLAGR